MVKPKFCRTWRQLSFTPLSRAQGFSRRWRFRLCRNAERKKYRTNSVGRGRSRKRPLRSRASCGEFRLLQSGSDRVQNDQSKQISAGGDAEENPITVSQLQDVACEESEKCAAQGPCHASDTDDCAHGSAREH